MKAWLATPISRGEAIAWALFVPALAVVGYCGKGMVRSIGALPKLARDFKIPLGSTLEAYVSIGQAGVAAAFAICALVPLAALLTQQRAWVRIAAPVVFGFIAYCLLLHFGGAVKLWSEAAGEHYGVLPR